MSASKNSEVRDFFEEKPIGMLSKANCSVNEIQSEILNFNSAGMKFDETNDASTRFGQLKLNASRCLDEIMQNVQEAAESCDENLASSVFLIYLEEFFRMFKLSLNESNSQRLRKQNNLASAEDSTKRLDKQVAALTAEWEVKQNQHVEKVNAMQLKIENLNSEINRIRSDNNEKIFSAIQDGNITLIKGTNLKQERIKEIPELIQTVEVAKRKADDRSLIEIQKLKEQKIKSEQVLQTILVQFDGEVGAKEEELQDILRDLRMLRKNYEIWKEKFDEPLQILYNQVMLQKEQEEREALEEEEEVKRKSENVNVKQLSRQNKTKTK